MSPKSDTWAKIDAELTKIAKSLYLWVFKEPFPAKWQMMWGVDAATIPKVKWIVMSFDQLKTPYDFEVLFHEFIHMREPTRPHGKRFDKLARTYAKEALTMVKEAMRANTTKGRRHPRKNKVRDSKHGAGPKPS